MKYILIIFVLITSGCSEEVSDSITMQPLSVEQWYKKLNTYKHKIVVADLWASWCSNCIKRFPHMITLYEKYKNKNVIFVSLNLDDHEDTDSLRWAQKFLVKQNATFDNYHINENLMLAFKKLDLISIPVVLIYGRDGKERYRLTGNNPNNQFSEKDVEAGILTLLNEH